MSIFKRKPKTIWTIECNERGTVRLRRNGQRVILKNKTLYMVTEGDWQDAPTHTKVKPEGS